MSGIFITFEGIDKCGKSTQAGRLAQKLVGLGRKVLETHEPGGTELGRHLRKLALQRGEEPVSDMTEVFLFAADRAQHVSRVICPALESGTDVLCDRFSDSSLAYQGYGRGGDVEAMVLLQRQATQGLVPDLTVLVDIDVETARSRGVSSDRIEDEGAAFYDRVRQGFLSLSEQDPGRFLVLDGTRPEKDLESQVFETVQGLLKP
jgi:dTMP kinase